MSQSDEGLTLSVLICARRETVFRFFTETERFAAWWGEGSRIEPRPGGKVLIRYPNGDTASGVVQEIAPPSRIAFTYGYDAPGKPIPPGGSLVTIALSDEPGGTRVTLTHTGIDARVRALHVPGWRYQLTLFSNAATAVEHGGVEQIVDRYFAAWSETDPGKRRALLQQSVTADVGFSNGFGVTEGLDALNEHITASQLHVPNVKLHRDGAVARTHGTALVRWDTGVGGGKGSNVFDLAPDGRLRRIVGFWGV